MLVVFVLDRQLESDIVWRIRRTRTPRMGVQESYPSVMKRDKMRERLNMIVTRLWYVQYTSWHGYPSNIKISPKSKRSDKVRAVPPMQ